MKAIIFGANGQDGHYLKTILLEQGIEVIGVSRTGEHILGDVSDRNFVRQQIQKIKPAFIFHLAANSNTTYEVWYENHKTICDGTLYILDAVKEHCPDCKVFISGSALQFKNEEVPLNERAPFESSSPYALSRIHSVYAARYYRCLGLKTYVGYFFNHDSPRRSSKHINIKIVETLKRIAKGSNEKLQIGDLHAQKEFGYAKDIMEGVVHLVSQDAIYEACIGTGLAYSLQDWIQVCSALLGVNRQDYISINHDYISPYRILVSDPTTMHQLGWRHRTTFEELAKIICEKC